MPSPVCTINTQDATDGVDVNANALVEIELLDTAGVMLWSVTCFGTDEQHTAAEVNATLVVNQTTKKATFTTPASGDGGVYLFSSVVNNGVDSDGNAVPAYTTTLGAFVLPSQ